MSNSNKKLKVSVGGFTSAGIKPENQDAFAALTPKGSHRELKGVVACLADGVSCSENAQQASQMAVSQFVDDYYSTPDSWTVKTAASKILSALNAWLFQHSVQSSAKHNGFVTTFSSVVIKSNTLHLFHIGDSRIYRCRKGQKLERLTRDHAQQAGDRMVLTRALGMDNRIEIDYKQEEVEEGDIFILTSDGVHAFVDPAEIRQAIEGNDDLEYTASRIIQYAMDCGSDDNLTCLLVKVEELPVVSIEEAHRQLTERVIPPVMDTGMKIDGYVIQRVLYSGTRSHLYLVQHPDHSHPYVLKAPSANFAEDPQYLEGFIREQWIGMRIDHESLMKTYAAPTNSKFLYYLSEYIEGQTLRQWMIDHPNPPLEKVREIIHGVITGLRVLQRLEMVHRDLKPENVMISKDGIIKLIDFGTVKVKGLAEISSAVEEEIPVGSVDYIAPEYLLFKDGSFKADLFSLGVIVYEMLTGKIPFKMPNTRLNIPKSLSAWHYESARLHNKKIPVWIDSTLKKGTQPDQSKRYDSFSEFYEDLCKPNLQLVESEHYSPLIEKNPVAVWQGISALLLFIILLQWIFLIQ